ncbi:MAG: hypothetical protein AAF484_07165 [Pseudomonadota bacterium]
MRGVLAGPLALLAAIAVMGGMAVWWPAGRAQVNNIAIPVILFPLIWVTLFIYAILDEKLPRIFCVLTGLIVFNALLIAIL